MKIIIMKNVKTLIATNKTKDKAMRQAKGWFKKNPNRKLVNIKLSDKTIKVKREEVIK